MFRDLELGHGRQAPGGPQAVVVAQGREAQCTAAQLALQIPLHPGQVVMPGRDMEGIDHDLGGLVRRQGSQQLAPELPPAFARQQVGLQLGPQQRPGLATQALDHMAEIDPPQWPALARSPMQPRQGFDELAAQVEVQPVMAQMHRELLTDQP